MPFEDIFPEGYAPTSAHAVLLAHHRDMTVATDAYVTAPAPDLSDFARSFSHGDRDMRLFTQPFEVKVCLASDRDRLAGVIRRAREVLAKVDLANLDYHDDGASVAETSEAIVQARAILDEAKP